MMGGSGSVPLTNGSGAWRPKHELIRKSELKYSRMWKVCLLLAVLLEECEEEKKSLL
jgi:hypothetical protein